MEKISKKANISHEKAYEAEIKEIKKRKIPLHKNVSLERFSKINTKYGNVNLHCSNNKSKKIVIFVHGINANSYTSIKLFDYYISRDYKIITYDNLGWGLNNSHHCTYGNKEAYLLNDVIQFVKKHFKKVEIVHGESMGGGTVYSYLGKYGNKQANKFIIDSGYNSFIKNVLIKANQKIPFFAYLTYPWLSLLLFFSGIKVRNFIPKKKLQNMKNIYHFHTPEDDMVDYKMMFKYKKLIHFKTIKNIRHVKAYYDAKNELYKYLDKINS